MRFTLVTAALIAAVAAAPTAAAADEPTAVETPETRMVDVHVQVACRDYDKYFWCVENGCGPIGPDLCMPGFTCAILWCT